MNPAISNVYFEYEPPEVNLPDEAFDDFPVDLEPI